MSSVALVAVTPTSSPEPSGALSVATSRAPRTSSHVSQEENAVHAPAQPSPRLRRRVVLAFVLSLLALLAFGAELAAAQEERRNMRLMGHNDLQARSA